MEIELDDISSYIDYWKNSVVCYVMGAYPLFTMIKGFIKRLWPKYGINKITMLWNGKLLVWFDDVEGKKVVIEGGLYHFDNKPFTMKAWYLYMEFTKEKLLTIPIWVKFPVMTLTLKFEIFYILTILPLSVVSLFDLWVTEMVDMILNAFESVLFKFVVLNILKRKFLPSIDIL